MKEFEPNTLLSAAAVRTSAKRMLDEAQRDELWHFRYDPSRLEGIADRIAAVTRSAYPDLAIPFHARWRHFEVGGRDRWAQATAGREFADVRVRARSAFDLAIVSVLLDAGSGGHWSFREAGSADLYRSSEGLGLASFALIASGRLSAIAEEPFRADASRLQEFDETGLSEAFQVRPDNPLVGLEGRVHLLRRLGAITEQRPDLFSLADRPRPGGLADAILARAKDGEIAAPAILGLVLEALGPIWPARLILDGIALGDAWDYPRWRTGPAPSARSIVPFHKLSQWLTYSLIEPTQAMGIRVIDIGGLTGLAEYRNGGLLIDGGVLVLRDESQRHLAHAVASSLVVEWRAMTVALLDVLHPMVAERLGLSLEAFPLACLLEGGSWAAGRQIARQLRADGSPPLTVASDGTTF